MVASCALIRQMPLPDATAPARMALRQDHLHDAHAEVYTMFLDIVLLRTFVAVVEAKGFTRAAGFVNLTQSAVSLHIKRLEEQVGRRLFDRTAAWLARQITEAFPWASAPAYLLRDNDRAYGHVFTTRVTAMGIRDRPISPESPWQNSIAERLIGTLRRECLDHMVIFGEAHLRRILSAYAVYYNQ